MSWDTKLKVARATVTEYASTSMQARTVAAQIEKQPDWAFAKSDEMSGDLKRAMEKADSIVSGSSLLTSITSSSWAEFKKTASEQDVILAVDGIFSLKPHLETISSEVKALLGSHALRAKRAVPPQ